uniref:Uncharacterized protein n=1 Tax=Ditylenchus dipsaci TaxID=166011 RepID=A0A915DDG8_9BILA
MEPDDRIALAVVAARMAGSVLFVGTTVMNAERKAALAKHQFLLFDSMRNVPVFTGTPYKGRQFTPADPLVVIGYLNRDMLTDPENFSVEIDLADVRDNGYRIIQYGSTPTSQNRQQEGIKTTSRKQKISYQNNKAIYEDDELEYIADRAVRKRHIVCSLFVETAILQEDAVIVVGQITGRNQCLEYAEKLQRFVFLTPRA